MIPDCKEDIFYETYLDVGLEVEGDSLDALAVLHESVHVRLYVRVFRVVAVPVVRVEQIAIG